MRTLEEAAREAAGCTRCRLSGARTQVVYGVGDPHADLMFLGEGPGFHEDQQGEPFVGPAGQLLNHLLGEIGIQREEVYIANVVKCRPPGNRDPRPDEIEACAPWLREQMDLIDPVVVATLGRFAAGVMLDRQVSVTRVRGQKFSVRGRIVIPTFHPAAVLRGGESQMQAIREDFEVFKATLAEPGPEPEPPQEQLGLF